MTIDEIRVSTKDVLTPSDIAPILCCHPYSLNIAAKADIKALGFPASLIWTRLRIPRVGFLRWLDGGSEETK